MDVVGSVCTSSNQLTQVRDCVRDEPFVAAFTRSRKSLLQICRAMDEGKKEMKIKGGIFIVHF